MDVTKDREKYIGGSDVPIIMGLSPFMTRFELLQFKAGIREDDFAGNKYTEYGHIMEPKIREFWNGNTYNFVEDMRIDGDLRYHADGYDKEANAVLEIKTTSQVKESLDEYKQYLVQLLLGMDMFGADTGYLLVYERPKDFSEEFDESRLTSFKIDMESQTSLLNEVYEAINLFINDKKKLAENPFLTEQELLPQEVITLSTKIEALESEMVQHKKAKDQYDRFRDELKKAMTKYGIDKWTTENGVRFTLVPDGEDKTVMEFDSKQYIKDHPKGAKKYMVEKVKKGRAGYVRVTVNAGV